MRLSELGIPAITGYYQSDEVGYPLGARGVPNVKLGDDSDYLSSEYYFEFYPKPCETIAQCISNPLHCCQISKMGLRVQVITVQ